jgi:hypothetical protein
MIISLGFGLHLNGLIILGKGDNVNLKHEGQIYILTMVVERIIDDFHL